MSRRMPAMLPSPMPMEFPVTMRTAAGEFELPDEAAYMRVIIGCRHELVHETGYDPGGLEADRYVRVRGCSLCGTWVLARGGGCPPAGRNGGREASAGSRWWRFVARLRRQRPALRTQHSERSTGPEAAA